MKNIFITLLFLLPILLKAQSDDTTKYSKYPNVYGIQYPRLWANKVLRIPTDTLNSKNGLAQIGTTIYVGNGSRWQPVTGGSSIDTSLLVKYYDSTVKYVTPRQLANSVARFNHDVIVNGTTLGAFGNGETIPLNGKRVDSLPDILAIKCSHPSYLTPTASISASPAATSYEYGINLGTITLSSGFNQNNGGGLTATTYYQNGSALGSNTTTISSLTTTQTFYVNKAYGQGAIINDNCGVPDPTGRINAFNVNSGSISFTPYHKRYLGFSSTLQGDGTPSDANVLSAYYIDTNGGSASINNTAAQQGGDKYLFFVTTSLVTSISINGFPSTAAFNLNIQRTFVNAAGGSFTYYFMVSKNPFGSTGTTTISIN